MKTHQNILVERCRAKTIAIFNKTFPFWAIQTNDTRFSISFRFTFAMRTRGWCLCVCVCMWRYRFVLNQGAFKIGHVIESESSKKEHTMHWMNGMRAKKGNYLFDVVRSHLPFFPLFLSLFVHSHFSHKYYPLGFGFVRICALAIYFERHTANAKIDETSAGEVIFHYKSMSDSSQASKQRTYSLWNIFSFWFYSTTCFSLLLVNAMEKNRSFFTCNGCSGYFRTFHFCLGLESTKERTQTCSCRLNVVIHDIM